MKTLLSLFLLFILLAGCKNNKEDLLDIAELAKLYEPNLFDINYTVGNCALRLPCNHSAFEYIRGNDENTIFAICGENNYFRFNFSIHEVPEEKRDIENKYIEDYYMNKKLSYKVVKFKGYRAYLVEYETEGLININRAKELTILNKNKFYILTMYTSGYDHDLTGAFYKFINGFRFIEW